MSEFRATIHYVDDQGRKQMVRYKVKADSLAGAMGRLIFKKIPRGRVNPNKVYSIHVRNRGARHPKDEG